MSRQLFKINFSIQARKIQEFWNICDIHSFEIEYWGINDCEISIKIDEPKRLNFTTKEIRFLLKK